MSLWVVVHVWQANFDAIFISHFMCHAHLSISELVWFHDAADLSSLHGFSTTFFFRWKWPQLSFFFSVSCVHQAKIKIERKYGNMWLYLLMVHLMYFGHFANLSDFYIVVGE